MLIIGDKGEGASGFLLSQLFREVLEQFGLAGDDEVCVLRIGGVGREIQRCESVIDNGGELRLSMAQLAAIANSPEERVQILSCVNDRVWFGISDSTAMFLQGTDKQAETAVARSFADVRIVSDRPPI